ncbi:MAG: microviridin/marinostatin family tricyclic proteinase inhibitor [Planctomycetota bacterium]
MEDTKQKPFFARYLEGQTTDDRTTFPEVDADVKGGKSSRYKAIYGTLKYPSDSDEGPIFVTLKFPSDSEG